MKAIKYYLIFILFLFLSSCTTVTHHRYKLSQDCAPDFKIDASKIPDAVPKPEPLSKYGNKSLYVVLGKKYTVLKTAKGYDETGIASWYGMKFDSFRTSSGELYDVKGMSAASKVLPLPTYCQVTNLKNGKKCIVKVNDRGPFHENRIIDLSYAAAAKLGVIPTGTALVEVKAIDPHNPNEVLANTQTQAPIGNPEIYLQIGAFRVENNANKLESEIKQQTKYPVYIKQADKDGSPIYRVQIGPIPDVDNTDNLHDTLEKLGLGNPITVIQ